MDLRLYFRVIWRFRLIVGAGLLLGLTLALLSYTRISFKNGKPTIAYRQSNTWESSATLFVTQAGFPWGRTVLPGATTDSSGTTLTPSNFADPNRFANLAAYYTQLANSDAVRDLLRKGGPINGTVLAVALQDQTSQRSLQPFLQINGFAANARTAVELANREVAAFKLYLRQQQDASGTPTTQRVSLSTINRAEGAVLAAGRRKTTPTVIFLTVMLASIGLAFILENLRSSVYLVGKGTGEPPAEDRRRSA